MFANKTKVLSKLKNENLELELNCYVSFDSTASFSFTHTLLTQLNKLSVDVSLDCYVHNNQPITPEGIARMENLSKMSNEQINAFYDDEIAREKEYDCLSRLKITDLSGNKTQQIDLPNEITNYESEDQLFYIIEHLSKNIQTGKSSLEIKCDISTKATVSMYWDSDLIKNLTQSKVALQLNLINSQIQTN